MSQTHSLDALAFDLTDRLHKALRVSGHTTTTLATAMGVHRNTVTNYLAGRTVIDRRSLIAWSFATGVPLEWLEHGGGGEVQPPTDPGSTDRYTLLRVA